MGALYFICVQEGGWAANDPANQRNDGIPNDYMPQGVVCITFTYFCIHLAKGCSIQRVRKAEIQREETEQLVFKLKRLFQSEGVAAADGVSVGLGEHVEMVKNHFEMYSATLFCLLHRGVEISKACRPRILAVLWAFHYWKLTDYLLERFEHLFQLPEVLRGLQLLDSGRRIRALEKRLARLEANKCTKKRKMGQMRSQIHDLKAEPSVGNGTVSGSLAKRIRKWVGSIPTSKLAFYALAMPKEGWKDLADIIHLSPNDFQISWFLPLCFDDKEKLPVGQDSLLDVKDRLKKDGSNLQEILEQFKNFELPFTFIRQVCDAISDQSKEYLASYTPLDTLLWYHEEMTTSRVNQIIRERLQAGEKVTLGYGKLMERLLYFKRTKNTEFFDLMIPLAQRRLEAIKLNLEAPCVVLGDASYSMDVAVRTATIIASVLTILTAAELKFFHVAVLDPPKPVKNVQDVIEVAEAVKADQLTAPACALLPYYERRMPVKCFVVVTDEIENEKFGEYYFPHLFKKYYEEVYPAKVVFVSFLDSAATAKKGRMVTALEAMGIDVMTFRLDGARPDLTKLDTLLGILSSENANFHNFVQSLSTEHFSTASSSSSSASAQLKEDTSVAETRQLGALKCANALDPRMM